MVRSDCVEQIHNSFIPPEKIIIFSEMTWWVSCL